MAKFGNVNGRRDKKKDKYLMEKSTNKKEIDMLNGPLAGKLIFFALPLAFSSILQQLFNSADVAIVGKFCGDNSLAAVGANVAIVGVFVNLVVGLSVGPNAALANLIGSGKKSGIHDMEHTAIGFGALLGFLLMLIGIVTAKPVLELSGTPEEIMAAALKYIYIYFIGMPFIVIYNFAAAVLRSFGDTKRPMYVLFLTGVINVVLNLFFVIVCDLDVAGVAIATTISNIISAAAVIIFLCRDEGEFKLHLRQLEIKKSQLRKMLQIGIPTGVSSAVFSLSNIFIQSGINTFGADAIAGSSLELTFEYFSYDITSTFAQTAVTFMSQNYGAGKLRRCNKIFCMCLAFGFLFAQLLSTIFLIGQDFFIYIYTSSASVAAYAAVRLHFIGGLEGFTATYEVGGSGMRAFGKSLEPAIITILGTVGFRLLWLVTVFKTIHTFESLMAVYMTSWILTGGTILFLYFRLYKRLLKEHEGSVCEA